MAEEKTQEAKAPEQGAQNVQTIAQAIHVLVQAADIGRKAGIFDWQDLSLIKQSMDLLTAKPNAGEAEKMNKAADDSAA